MDSNFCFSSVSSRTVFNNISSFSWFSKAFSSVWDADFNEVTSESAAFLLFSACLIAFRILAAVSIASERAALASVQSEKLRLLKVFNVVFVSIIAFSVVCFFLSNASFAVTSCSEASPCAWSNDFSAFSKAAQSFPSVCWSFVLSFCFCSTESFACSSMEINSSTDAAVVSTASIGLSRQSIIAVCSCSSNSSSAVFAFSATVFAAFFFSRSEDSSAFICSNSSSVIAVCGRTASSGWWVEPQTGHFSPSLRSFAKIPARQSSSILSALPRFSLASSKASRAERNSFCLFVSVFLRFFRSGTCTSSNSFISEITSEILSPSTFAACNSVGLAFNSLIVFFNVWILCFNASSEAIHFSSSEAMVCFEASSFLRFFSNSARCWYFASSSLILSIFFWSSSAVLLRSSATDNSSVRFCAVSTASVSFLFFLSISDFVTRISSAFVFHCL